MLGIRLIERIHIEVVKADAVINNCERSDRRRLFREKRGFSLDDNADSGRALRSLRIPDCLKRIHDRFEEGEYWLPFGKLCLPDKISDICAKHSKPARFCAL